MNPMFRRSALRLGIFAASFALVACSLHAGAQQDNARKGRKYKVPPASSRIEITVLRDANGKPIEHAAVIFHPIEGERDKGGMELKSNPDGIAVIDVIPIGDIVRLQVIAKGFQTYGIDFNVDKPAIALEVRMKRPGEQYSIYKNHGETASGETPAKAPKEAAPATDGKQPANANEADNQAAPSKTQPQTN
jgi:hypothetical protein